MRRVLSLLLAAVMTLGTVAQPMQASAAGSKAQQEYEIYPIPHSIVYENGDYIIKDQVNVVYEAGIDQATKDRIQEIAALKGLTLVEEAAQSGETNLLVGIAGNADTRVDDYMTENQLMDAEILTKIDSYILSSRNGTIAILGKDVDSSFYGATTLYHVVNQIDSRTIRNFLVKDYADVVSRGFIEGYYGNPWSTNDRKNLMTWGGYYKLNSYFYAPKDDPKHNARWKELYSDEEIQNKIAPLAEAGNKSKCRFVYALHPYMHNPIRYDTPEHYNEDMAALIAKFDQVVNAGVRQIAVLADDAGLKRPEDYRNTLQDLTNWIKQKQTQDNGKYADLKLALPFCVQEYMNGVNSLPEYYKTFPDNVQIMVTGGAIWGDVYKNFNTPFTQKFGHGPYLWVNWPCSDNSKDNLVMGGYQVLHTDVEPGTVDGIVLNPMQQSEPSKVAIFGNACYSWNIWDEAERAQAYHDSFKYVDHNSAVETPASTALRELSKHMQNHKAGGSPRHEESHELSPKIAEFKRKMNAGTLTAQDVDAMIEEFVVLQDAAKTFRAQGNKDLKGDIGKDYTGRDANEQMAPWIDTWDDVTAAAIYYLNAVKCTVGETMNVSGLLANYNAAQEAMVQANSHAFFYINHMEYARVGRQYIMPFLESVDQWLGAQAQSKVDPSVQIQSWITNVPEFEQPDSGHLEDMFDQDDNTKAIFKGHLYLKANDYVGIKYSKPITLNSIRIVMGTPKDHFHHSKLEYTNDGKIWKPVNDQIYDRPTSATNPPIEVEGLNIPNVVGVRMIATQDNGVDAWIEIATFNVNAQEIETVPSYEISGNQITIENAALADQGNHGKNNLVDGNKNTELWLKSQQGDSIPVNASVTLDLGSVKPIGSVYFAQDTARNNGGDVIDKGVVEYQDENGGWIKLGDLTSKHEQTVNASAPVEARYIRIKNTQAKPIWWRLSEVTVFAPQGSAEPDQYTGTVTVESAVVAGHNVSKLIDGDKSTELWLKKSAEGADRDTIPAGAAVVLDMGSNKNVGSVYFAQGSSNSGDIIDQGVVEYKADGAAEWTKLGDLAGKTEQTVFADTAVQARYIRVKNTQTKNIWWRLAELTVYGPIPEGAQDDHLYTNLEHTNIRSKVTADYAELTAGAVTLAPGQYIGVDLGKICELSTVTLPLNLSGTDFQISANGLVWTNVTAEQAVQMMALTPDNISTSEIMGRRIRYARFINNTEAPIDLSIDQFRMNLTVVGQLGVLLSDDIPDHGWGDTATNGQAFDGNMNTTTKFGGNPAKGNTAVYSLGREMDIHSIRVYNADTECDYIRDCKIQLSADGEHWKTALVIGDGVTDTDRETPFGSISDSAKKTDSNYPNKFYYGDDQIPAEVGNGARFLRILITANYPSRALVMNEIMLNEGAYLSPEGNKAFQGTVEAPGRVPSNMLDKNMSTSYKPSAANGSITYSFSDSKTISGIRLMQNGATSNAVVTAKVVQNDTVKTLTLGTLSQAMNEFFIPADAKVLSITVTWTDKLPEISEIILMPSGVKAADNKDQLTALADGTPDAFETWTSDAQQEYRALQEDAKKVAASEYVSKVSVEAMIRSLTDTSSYAQKARPETLDAIRQLVTDKVSNEQKLYEVNSYKLYEEQLQEADDALKSADTMTQHQAEKLLAKCSTAKDNLVWSVYQREVAEQNIEQADAVNAQDYTEESYNNLKGVRDELAALVAQDRAGNPAVDPAVFAEKNAAFMVAMEALTPKQDRFTLAGSTVALDNNLQMKFAVKLSDLAGREDVKAVITETNPDGSKVVTEKTFQQWEDGEESGQKYVVYGDLSAKEMCNQIEVVICDQKGNPLSMPYITSIQNYAEKILNGGFIDPVKTVVVDMLNYGAAAQIYFNYNVDHLANAILTPEQKALATESVNVTDEHVGSTNYVTTSLSLEDNIVMNLYFQGITTDMHADVTYVDHTNHKVTYPINGTEFQESKIAGVMSIPVETLAMADGWTMVECVVKDENGNEVASVTDSMASYAARALKKSTDTKLNNLLDMTMKFSKSAYNHFQPQ